MCVPCALPWLAGLLAALGIHGPWLPFGATRLVLAAFMIYRLAQLIAIDDGPKDIFLRLRDRIGCYEYGEDGRPLSGWARLLGCPYCLGVWFSLPALALVIWPSAVGDLVLAMLGIAGAQAWLQGERNERAGG